MSLILEDDVSVVDHYRTLLKRTAWRIQYAAKIRKRKEWLVKYDESLYMTQTDSSDIITRFYLFELLSYLSSNKEKYILQKIYMDGFTEKELAIELKISQQAVNKCKRKAIQSIRQKIDIS
ncbi:hypothetical protein [Chengkuizengella axinellae]|uniref:Sigma-70 family RNA polymerase sigma factor n=1 Tax=Chengkuizengella axinellae TaxID=3064388 RepID=A0ABT9J619_9BACL|nr:hypothetical protein [Chengkuizengella sp. 2205SS18-9]MDP5277062.1 hypothetical protein [Chengkuizengella sp. 2205SS18-9]